MSRFDSAVLCVGTSLGAAALILFPWLDSAAGNGASIWIIRFTPLGSRPDYASHAFDVLACELLAIIVLTAGLIAVRRIPVNSRQRMALIAGVTAVVVSLCLLPWERTESGIVSLTHNWRNVSEYQWFFRLPHHEVYPDAPNVGVNLGRVALQLLFIGMLTIEAIKRFGHAVPEPQSRRLHEARA